MAVNASNGARKCPYPVALLRSLNRAQTPVSCAQGPYLNISCFAFPAIRQGCTWCCRAIGPVSLCRKQVTACIVSALITHREPYRHTALVYASPSLSKTHVCPTDTKPNRAMV